MIVQGRVPQVYRDSGAGTHSKPCPYKPSQNLVATTSRPLCGCRIIPQFRHALLGLGRGNVRQYDEQPRTARTTTCASSSTQFECTERLQINDVQLHQVGRRDTLPGYHAHCTFAQPCCCLDMQDHLAPLPLPQGEAVKACIIGTRYLGCRGAPSNSHCPHPASLAFSSCCRSLDFWPRS